MYMSNSTRVCLIAWRLVFWSMQNEQIINARREEVRYFGFAEYVRVNS